MNERRLKKISNQIKRIVSELIMQEKIKDHRITKFTSITDVETTDDLRFCYIYVSNLEDNYEQAEQTMRGLNSAKGFIRSVISKNIRLQFTPEPIFRVDDTIKNAMKVEDLLRGIHKDDADYIDDVDDADEE